MREDMRTGDTVLVNLERLLLAIRGAAEILLDSDAYDRWGASHDTEASRAEHFAVAQQAERDHERLTRELTELVDRTRTENAEVVARWADLHVAYLQSLPFDASSTEAYVRGEECKEWQAIARGERAFVKENVYFIRIDPTRYERAFGFAPPL